MVTFEELLETYRPEIESIIRYYTAPRLRRDELLQEACLALWEAYPRIDWSKNVRGFVRRVVARHLRDVAAKYKRDILYYAESEEEYEGAYDSNYEGNARKGS